MTTAWPDKIDALVEHILSGTRQPGAAVAIVKDGQTVFAKGYGQRDVGSGLTMERDTQFPIASISKSLNATLIAMLVEDGLLDWDRPVRDYLPSLELRDPVAREKATLRDLILMRTGLPRHDWAWYGRDCSRSEMVAQMAYLEPSAGFRERFQYTNLTTTLAGHIAELVTDRHWEELVEERIFGPLGMTKSGSNSRLTDDTTRSYFETSQRQLIETHWENTEVIGPAGGSIVSTVADMARWASFNLGHAPVPNLVRWSPLAALHAGQVMVGDQPEAISPDAMYALGWFVDHYRNHRRISHGGYLHDVNSDVSLFPDLGLGIVSFGTFGAIRPARFLNQCLHDLIADGTLEMSVDQKLSEYESRISELKRANNQIRRVADTGTSQGLAHLCGTYTHDGYGKIVVSEAGEDLSIVLNECSPMIFEQLRFNIWIPREDTRLVQIMPRPLNLNRINRLTFEPKGEGDIAGLRFALDPAVSPTQFIKTGDLAPWRHVI